MTNYSKTKLGNEGRVELHDALKLTGAEISINTLPAGAGVPFVHSHRKNEEAYGILSGKGKGCHRRRGNRAFCRRLAANKAIGKASVLGVRR